MEPESISSQEYKTHSDIWSLGCTVLEMITGRLSWPCDQNTKIGSIMIKIGCTNQVSEIPIQVSKEAKDFFNSVSLETRRHGGLEDICYKHIFTKQINI